MLIPFIEEFRSPKSPWQVFQAVYDAAPTAFFLDSIHYNLPDQRYSYIGFSPFIELEIEAGQSLPPHKLKIRGAENAALPANELIPTLRKFLKRYAVSPKHKRDYFTGGAVGFWGYELISVFEDMEFRPKPAADFPHLFLGFYRDLIVYDHKDACYFLVTHTDSGERAAKAKTAARIAEMKAFFESTPEWNEDFNMRGFRPEISQAKFEAMVKAARRYIAAGDIYQANLSQRFSFEYKGSTLKLYERLRELNPSPFASFLKIGKGQIVSCSPERLIRKKGRYCETRPIAGTRPRQMAGRRDAQLRRELLSNEKERAEHIMLVDLERNDLGRVCDWNSVKVEEMMKIERYSHVLHIVSKVSGHLQKDKDALDLIPAMFPGGTITGCPKIRCMQIIDELEPIRRGLYTGSIGYLDFHGDMDLNIIIRTLLLNGGTGHLQVGAGIVYDSDPSREFQETLYKGEALAQALAQASV